MAVLDERENQHDKALRASGLRLLQIWVPRFAEECYRQSKLAAQAENFDSEPIDAMTKHLIDTEGWTE